MSRSHDSQDSSAPMQRVAAREWTTLQPALLELPGRIHTAPMHNGTNKLEPTLGLITILGAFTTTWPFEIQQTNPNGNLIVHTN